jgi:hypothetical protein
MEPGNVRIIFSAIIANIYTFLLTEFNSALNTCFVYVFFILSFLHIWNPTQG